MNRAVTLLSTVTVAGCLVAAAAPSASAAPTGLDKADVHFLQTNEQVNLTEITLAKIVLAETTNGRAVALATVTLSDHLAAQAANEKVAAADGVTLPTSPNPMQQAAAEALAATDAAAIPLTYFKDQVAGHRGSIAQTRAEIAHGSAADVLAYAKYYLPIAAMHLRMSTHDLRHVLATD